MEKELFLVEVGTIASKEEVEEIYSQVYDKKYAYYDENQFYTHNYQEALEFISEFCTYENKYGVISKQGISPYTEKDLKNGNYNFKNNLYSANYVVYSFLFKDNSIHENFIEGGSYFVKQSQIILEDAMILECDTKTSKPKLVEYYLQLFEGIEERYERKLEPDENVNAYVLVDVLEQKGVNIYFTMYSDSECNEDFKVFLNEAEKELIYNAALTKFKEE